MAPPFVHHVGARIRAGHVVQGIKSPTIVVVVAIFRADILLVVLSVLGVPEITTAVGIVEDDVVDRGPVLGVAVGSGAFPGDFAAEVFRAEHGVHGRFQVMTGRGITVEVDAAGGFEQPAHLHEPDGHPGEVCLHSLRMSLAGGGDDVSQRRVLVLNLSDPFLFHIVQRPGVLE